MSEHQPLKSSNIPPALNISIPKIEDIDPPVKQWDWNELQLPTDVLLLTVKDPELLNCYYCLKNVFTSYCNDLGWVYFGEIGDSKNKKKAKVSLVRCALGALEPRGSLTMARNAILCLKPKAVFSVGFCAGLNREKTKLGDVVISAKLSTYASKKVAKDGREESRGYKANVSKNMGKLILAAATGWKAPLEDPKERKVKVHCNGEMLSGPELVDFSGRQEQLHQQHPNAIAIEMEGEGVYVAAFDLEVEWVVIKGISDFADGTKKETGDWQPFACAMAASVVKNILKNPDVLADWPHYKGISYKGQNTGYKWFSIIGLLVLLCAVAIGYKRLITIIGLLVLLCALGIGLLQVQNNNQKKDAGTDAVPIVRTHTKSSEDLLQIALQNLMGDSGQIQYKGRTLGYRAHRRIHSFKEPLVYDGVAWDIETNVSVKKKHFKESEDAIKEAVKELIKKLEKEGIIKI